MPKVTHFDMSGENPEKLIPFYKSIFGWEFTRWEGPMEYWMVKTGPEQEPGIDGGLGKRQTDNRTVNTIDVSNIDAVLKQIRAKGGKIVSDKSAIPAIGWFAQFEDPEGNIFGLMQSDPAAK